MTEQTRNLQSLRSGVVAGAANAYGPLDGVYTTDSGSTSWTATFELGQFDGDRVTAGTDFTFSCRVRKDAPNNNPQIDSIDLLNASGQVVQTLSGSVAISSAASQDINLTASAAAIESDASANGVGSYAIRFTTTAAGGNPSSRACVQLDYAALTLDTEAAPPPGPAASMGVRQTVYSQSYQPVDANNQNQMIFTIPAPQAGSVLAVLFGGDKSSGTVSMSDDGTGIWAKRVELDSSSVSLAGFTKTAAGDETTLTLSWTNATTSGNTALFVEVTGGDGSVSGVGTNPTDETSVTSKSTGVGTSSAAGYAIVFASVDSGQNIGAPVAWSDGFSSLYDPLPDSPGGRGTVFVAGKDGVPAGSVSSTFSHSGSADQLSAAVMVLHAEEALPPPDPEGGGQYVGWGIRL